MLPGGDGYKEDNETPDGAKCAVVRARFYHGAKIRISAVLPLW